MNGQAYAGAHYNQRIAVGCGLGGGAGTDNGARARAVLNNDLLAKGRREFLRDHSAYCVHTAAGWVWHDQRNRTRRATTAPPSSVMNVRRCIFAVIRSPRPRVVGQAAAPQCQAPWRFAD